MVPFKRKVRRRKQEPQKWRFHDWDPDIKPMAVFTLKLLKRKMRGE